MKTPIREIKFRVRRKDGTLIGYDRFKSSHWECLSQANIDKGDSDHWQPGTLAGDIREQYTGIKDINELEIYENDYCRSDHYQFGELVEGVVEYTHTTLWVLAQGSFKNSIHDLVFNAWRLEVIGVASK